METAYHDSRLTAEISRKMQVPDRIILGGGNTQVHDWANGDQKYSMNMQVPDRILVTGGSSDRDKVNAPPGKIRMPEQKYSSPEDHYEGEDPRSADHAAPQGARDGSGTTGPPLRTLARRESSDLGPHHIAAYREAASSSILAGTELVPRENLTVFEDMQLLRRQISKLNHRLMAVELENQQQQQREIVFSIAIGAYFVAKFLLWVNRS